MKPRNLGDTNFKAAFTRAYNDFVKNNSFEGGRKVKIIVFTDGRPDDVRRLSIARYFQEITAFLNKKFKGVAWDLYVVICDKKGDVYESTGGKWKKIAGGKNVFHIRNMGDLNSIFNKIVRKMFDIDDSIPMVSLSNNKCEESFEVASYIDRMEFHILASPNSKGLEVAIIKPDGKNLLENLKTGNSSKVKKAHLQTALSLLSIIPMQEHGHTKY